MQRRLILSVFVMFSGVGGSCGGVGGGGVVVSIYIYIPKPYDLHSEGLVPKPTTKSVIPVEPTDDCEIMRPRI